MAKLTLSNVSAAQGLESFATAINNNSQLIEDALENTFSRDGTSPNTINAALDVNGQRVYNLPAPLSNSDAARKVDVDNAIATVAPDAAEAAASAAAAAASAIEAASSASDAADSAAAVLVSETAAAASAAAALVSQNAAAASEVAAELAETNAEAAQSAAASSASSASTSASTATTQAGLADTARIAAQLAETNAETAETNAETAETNAAASASTATTQAGLANTARVAAELAETNAETAEANAVAALSSKANIASPTFTGTPAAPTAAPGTNTTQLATTAFVTAATSGSIADDSVTNAKLANVATNSIKGRVTAATGDPEDLTAAQTRTVIGVQWFMPVGTVLPYAGTTEPTGYVFCYGQAVSRTTYATLFTALSTTYGVGDGSTTFNLPDMRGRVPAGQDDMGGSSANRLVTIINGDTLGITGGAETHTLTIAEMPAHTHTYNDFANGGAANGGGGTQGTINATSNSTGGGGAHNNLQPTIVLNYIIFTGV